VKIRILGCYGGVTPDHKTTSFLINDSVLLDAGCASETLGWDELKKIRAILISHAHMDHVRDLLTLAENLFFLGGRRIILAAARPVLDIMLTHLFNNEIYPDFTRIPSPPVIAPLLLRMEKAVVLDGLDVTPVAVNHTVACSAFIVKENGRGFMFTSDSGQTQRCWELARQDEGIECIFADVSFPSIMEDTAAMSGHMTPRMLLACLRSFGIKGKTVYATHMKPFFCREIVEELKSMGEKDIRVLHQGGAVTL
jgi:3',5'-cyclic-nucleotide phosphodiesterase